jgi:hypothetical protein
MRRKRREEEEEKKRKEQECRLIINFTQKKLAQIINRIRREKKRGEKVISRNN